MKKFSQAIPALHEAEGAAKSELQKSYAEYFKAKLNKFGAKSPAELTPEQKTEFFNEITKDWSRGEGATKAGQADVEEHGVKESLGINESAMGEMKESTVNELKASDLKPGKKYSSPYGEVTFIQINPDGKTMKLHSKETGNVKTDVFNAVDMKLIESEEVNEGKEIKSEAEFKEYAMGLLKKAHPDDFDEAKANATVEGILKKCDGDFGAAVGMITSSLGESATNEKKDGITPEEISRIQQLKKLKDLKANEGEETCSMCKKDPCECYTNEGNAFGDAVKKAKDAGEKEFEFQGKTYKVEESEEPAVNDLNEGDVYIADTTITNESELKADVLKNVGNAFNQMLKSAGLKYNPVSVSEHSGRIKFDSKPLTGNDLGVMKYGLKEVYILIFNGGSMPKIQKDSKEFKFSPYIWCTLNYRYNHGSPDIQSQGSNGCSLYLPGETSDSIYYDIIGKKFLTQSEAAKRQDWR